MKGEIYVIFNHVNNKPYVGQTIKGYKRRFRKHKEASRRGSDLAIHRAIRKYGEDNFWVDLVETVTAKTEDELLIKLNQREIYWIKAFKF